MMFNKPHNFFLGTVINVNDPLQKGRVQVRIYGVHSESTDDIPHADLPWADVMLPSTGGGSSGIGSTVSITRFSQVIGFFLDGANFQIPIVIGTIDKYERDEEKGLSEQPSPHDFTVPVKKPSDIDVFLTGATNLEKAWNWFRSTLGGSYSPVAVSGILGNLWIESYATINNNDLSPTQRQVGGGPGYGLAQWEIGTDRYNELRERSKGLDINKMFTQLRFITYELDTYSYFGKSRLVEARTPEEASDIFMIHYERPKKYKGPITKPRSLGGTGTDDIISAQYSSAIERRNAARDIYENFTTVR